MDLSKATVPLERYFERLTLLHFAFGQQDLLLELQLAQGVLLQSSEALGESFVALLAVRRRHGEGQKGIELLQQGFVKGIPQPVKCIAVRPGRKELAVSTRVKKAGASPELYSRREGSWRRRARVYSSRGSWRARMKGAT